MASDSVVAAVEGYYAEKVRRHGATPSGVDWNGAEGQHLRFEQLSAIIRSQGEAFSLIDYGCGYGALLDWMEGQDSEFRYTGYDVSAAMIEEARSAHAARGSFTSDHAELVPAEYTVASGIFNVKLGASDALWARHVNDTIDEMVRLSTRGIAFNALTSHADADRRRPDLYYADPAELLDWCLRLYSRDVELRHNYELYEFTLLVRLDGRPPAAITRRDGNE